MNTSGGVCVKFNGSGAVAISASFNVTSVTDNTTGDYTVNFTTAFSSANYAASLDSESEDKEKDKTADNLVQDIDDIKPNDIFRLQKGSSKDRYIIAKY